MVRTPAQGRAERFLKRHVKKKGKKVKVLFMCDFADSELSDSPVAANEFNNLLKERGLHEYFSVGAVGRMWHPNSLGPELKDADIVFPLYQELGEGKRWGTTERILAMIENKPTFTKNYFGDRPGTIESKRTHNTIFWAVMRNLGYKR